jgi:hypothetical protein
VAAGEVDFLEVDAVHGNGSASPGLSFKSAWLNEGRLSATGMDSQPLAIDDPIIPAAVPPNGLRIGRVGDVLRLSVPGIPLRAIEIRTPDGRRLLSRRYEVPVSTVVLDGGALPAGILYLKAEGVDGGVRNGNLTFFRP